ncbi:MAG: hypothetical protein Q8900_12100 [Bacillota bacterium]|nr:hypothetical protein [Bacillota bacterium]
MKITAEFNSNEELLSFISTFGAKTFKAEQEACSKIQIVDQTVRQAVEEVPKVETKVISQETSKGEVVDVEPTPILQDPSKEKKDEDSKITKEQIRAVFTKLLKAGKSKEAKELTAKYGASKIPDLKQEDYEAVYKEAEGLL